MSRVADDAEDRAEGEMRGISTIQVQGSALIVKSGTKGFPVQRRRDPGRLLDSDLPGAKDQSAISPDGHLGRSHAGSTG